jgi:hypothetical protein
MQAHLFGTSPTRQQTSHFQNDNITGIHPSVLSESMQRLLSLVDPGVCVCVCVCVLLHCCCSHCSRNWHYLVAHSAACRPQRGRPHPQLPRRPGHIDWPGHSHSPLRTDLLLLASIEA